MKTISDFMRQARTHNMTAFYRELKLFFLLSSILLAFIFLVCHHIHRKLIHNHYYDLPQGRLTMEILNDYDAPQFRQNIKNKKQSQAEPQHGPEIKEGTYSVF